jgi:hypothetical protein
VAHYDKTLIRVGVTNGVEDWIFPETQPRLPGDEVGFWVVFSMFSPYANQWHPQVLWNNLNGYLHRRWRFDNAALPLHLTPGDHIQYTEEYGHTDDLLIGHIEFNLSGDPSMACGLGDWLTSVEIASNGEVAFHGAGAGSGINSRNTQVGADGIKWTSRDGRKNLWAYVDTLRMFMTGSELSEIGASDERGRITGQNITLVNTAIAENTAGATLNMAHVLSDFDRLRVLRYLSGDESDFLVPVQPSA